MKYSQRTAQPHSDSTVVQPIDEMQRDMVAQATERYIAQAEALFSRKFERVPVLFDLKGRAAGMFKVIGKRRLIRYNPWIFAKYFEENLRDTVPHEVAHFIVHELYPRRRVKPHGAQWQELMACFGIADADVTFDRDLDGVPQRSQRTHPYFCGCQMHAVSTTRHNRVQRRRMRYHCVSCDGLLVYAPGRDRPGHERPGHDTPGRDKPVHETPDSDRPRRSFAQMLIQQVLFGET